MSGCGNSLSESGIQDMKKITRRDFLKGTAAGVACIDCDCDGNPKKPEMADLGIFASTDPVALDQACYDAVQNADDKGKKALIKRMESKHAIHVVEAAAELGLGSREYEIVEIS